MSTPTPTQLLSDSTMPEWAHSAIADALDDDPVEVVKVLGTMAKSFEDRANNDLRLYIQQVRSYMGPVQSSASPEAAQARPAIHRHDVLWP